jgi:hypothetical protein
MLVLFCSAVPAGTAAGAPMAAAPAPIVRAMNAQVVVVGKVQSFEADTVDAEPYPGSQKVAHRVALVKVSDALLGAKGLTHLKVGWVHVTPSPNPKANRGTVSLPDGFEGCLYLRKHPAADFYTFDYMSQPLDAKAQQFEQEVASAKKMFLAATDPVKALKAEKADDRYLAAAYLLTRYTTRPAGKAEEVPVPADERGLLYDAILATNWAAEPNGAPAPAYLVTRLVQNRPGGFRPKPFTGTGDYNAVMKAEFKSWVAGDGATFELKKFLPQPGK